MRGRELTAVPRCELSVARGPALQLVQTNFRLLALDVSILRRLEWSAAEPTLLVIRFANIFS